MKDLCGSITVYAINWSSFSGLQWDLASYLILEVFLSEHILGKWWMPLRCQQQYKLWLSKIHWPCCMCQHTGGTKIVKKKISTSRIPCSHTLLFQCCCPSFQHTPASMPFCQRSNFAGWSWSHGDGLRFRENNGIQPPCRSLRWCKKVGSWLLQHWDSSSPWEQSLTPSHHWEDLRHCPPLLHDIPSEHW